MQTILASAGEIGARLRYERERLALSQADLAQIGGVSRNSQTAYETGKTPFTSEYLRSVAEAGVDPLYVISGERSADTLTSDQARLLEAFAALDRANQAALLQIVHTAAGLPTPIRDPALPSTAALTEAFDELLEQSPGLAGADLAHELAKRLPIILRAAADERASPASASRDADDAPPAARGGDRRATRHAPRT